MHARLLMAKELASLTGKIMSMSPALGPVTRLMTRSLYVTMNDRKSWCRDEALPEIEFCHTKITSFNRQQIWPKSSAVRVVYSDASATGNGGYVVEHDNLIVNGQWSPEDVGKSSTWSECRAVRMVLKSFQDKLKDERVCRFSDNQNVLRVVQCGQKIWAYSLPAKGIILGWIPREEN